jgi:hypothetical protein
MNKEHCILETLDIFSNVLYRFNNTNSYYELSDRLDKLFDSAKLKFRSGQPAGERIGALRSTAGIMDNEQIMTLPQMQELSEHIKKCVYRVHPDKVSSELIISKVLANRNYKGSSVRVHRHGINLIGVCIFYLNVPNPRSSELVIVDQTVVTCSNPGTLCNYTENHKKYISVNTGEIIIHPANVYHGVTEHTDSAPRTSIVFDYLFK